MKTSLLLLLATAATLVADDITEIPTRNSYAGVIRNAAIDDHQHAGFLPRDFARLARSARGFRGRDLDTRLAVR